MTDLGSPPRPRAETRRAQSSNGSLDSSHDLLQSLQAMRGGDFSVRMRGDYLGIDGKIADAFLETRLAGGWRSTYGMLDARFDASYIVDLLYPAAN